ncbi:MAG: carboxypeptidase-like regulatory domain-containing protein [Halobacteria archaeon]
MKTLLVPASALTDSEADFFDMRHEVRAYYTVRTEFVQEPTTGAMPIQERLFEAAKLEQAVVEQATLQQAFETPELLEIVDLLDVATNLPGELNETVFEKARALGIPVDTNLTFAAELESQAQNRSGAVLSLMDHTLNYTRDRFGAFVEAQAKQTAALVKEGKAMEAVLDSVGFQINKTRAQERFDKVVNEGFDPEEVADLQANFSLTSEDINATRQWIADNKAQIVNGNLSSAYRLVAREFWNGTAAQVDTAVAALENSVYWNTFYNRTRPLEDSLPQLTRYTRLSEAVGENLSDRNWSDVKTTASELAPLTWDLALSTGQFKFVDAYRNASVATAAATVALGGDEGLAVNVTQNLKFQSHVFISRADEFAVSQDFFALAPTYTFKFTALATQPGSVFPPTHALIRVERVDISPSGEETFTRICTLPIAFSGPSIERRECTVNLNKFETRWLAHAFVCDAPCQNPPTALHQFFSFQSNFITIRQGVEGTSSVFVDSRPQGAMVELLKKEADGTFQFLSPPTGKLTPVGEMGLLAGSYSVSVTHPDFQEPSGIDAIFQINRLHSFSFNLAEKQATINVNVVGARGEAIPGAEVVARDIVSRAVKGSPSPCFTTEFGVCVLTLGQGGYEIEAKKDGKTVFKTIVFVGRGQVVGVEARLLNDVKGRLLKFKPAVTHLLLGKVTEGLTGSVDEFFLGALCEEVCLETQDQQARHNNQAYVFGLLAGREGLNEFLKMGDIPCGPPGFGPLCKDDFSDILETFDLGDSSSGWTKVALLVGSVIPFEGIAARGGALLTKLGAASPRLGKVLGFGAKSLEEIAGVVKILVHPIKVFKLRRLGVGWDIIFDAAKGGERIMIDEIVQSAPGTVGQRIIGKRVTFKVGDLGKPDEGGVIHFMLRHGTGEDATAVANDITTIWPMGQKITTTPIAKTMDETGLTFSDILVMIRDTIRNPSQVDQAGDKILLFSQIDRFGITKIEVTFSEVGSGISAFPRFGPKVLQWNRPNERWEPTV